MDNQLYCPLCEDQYRDDNIPRMLITCGHSFCEKCLKKIMSQTKGSFKIVCPQDGQMVTLKDGNLSSIPKNIALMKIIESKKGNSSFKDPQLEMSKITKNEQFANEDDQAQDLVDAIISTSNVDSEQKIIDKQQSTKTEITQIDKTLKQQNLQEICKTHQKPLQVVCIFDLKKICVNCAIFGQHKGHQFKSLQEIQKERMDYYTSIIEIMDKKQTISSRISNEETCSSIMELLSNKKNKMKTAILQKYKKLIDAIQAKQKDSLKSLDVLMKKTETKVKNLMKIDPNLSEKYDNWEYKSYEQIKILQGQNFQAKLKLLFFQTSSETDVMQQGNKIVQEINKQQQNLFNQVQASLDNLGVDFNLDIFNHIQSFVQVLEQPKRKKSKARTTAITKVQVQSTTSFASPIISQTSLGKSGFFSPVKDQAITHELPELKSLTEEIHITHEQDLLDVEFDSVIEKEPLFVKTEQFNISSTSSQFSQNQSTIRSDNNAVSPSSKNFEKIKTTLQRQKSPKSFERAKKDDSFTQQKIERPNKKKLSKIKVPEKFEKIVDGLANDQLETIDLTNAELGDSAIIIISEFLNGSKARTVKFIRNKLTDDAIVKILPYLRGVITLNLSQNLLTQRVLDILIQGKQYLGSMRSIILSQNKIMQRKAKVKIDKLKALDLTISI